MKSEHGSGGCRCGQTGDTVEAAGCQTQLPLAVFINLTGGLSFERAAGFTADIF